ncbi:type I secretion C-terminal target domain-containing protein [Shewanella sp. MTB7]|nr:type I secretion C-terminal target domain-containing protein [Shewanella sp. MTB7]WBJ96106.1 type I secretion C-terminal target domain-containing protein [Shewanella sp. MTB7]
MAGNTGDVTDTTVLDTSAPGTGDGENQINFLDGGDELVSDAESGSVPLSGQVAVGSTVNSITISDGTTTITVNAVDITVAADGTVTVAGQDLSGLEDGTLTVTMNVTDLAGNTGDVTDTTVLDTSAPGTGDGENQINFLDGGDELVSDAESTSVPLSGQVAVGSTVNSITISDGTTTITVTAADISVAADGTVTVAGQDLSGLADGTLTVTMNVTDLAGNTGDVTDTTVLDTSAPGTGDGENQINFLDGGDELVSDAESTSVPLSGQVAVGSTVNSITISDGTTTITVNAADISVAADGTVTVAGQDLSSLADGTLTVTMNVTDLAGNTGDVTDTTVLDTSAPGTGDGENQINFLDGGDELVSDAESGSVPLSGQVAVGSTVNSITISDGITTITVAAADISVADGSVTVAGQDLSSLADGTLTVTMNVTDLAGNTGDVTDTTVLDTSAPGTGDGENQINFLDGGDELVSDAESGSVPLSGQVAVGSTVNSITISDGITTITVAAADITVAADGSVTVAGQDLSNLADGTLTVTMNVTDLAGNTGDVTDTTVLDTSAPGTGDGENQINFLDGGDELVSDAESGSVPLSGQVAVGSTVNSITISDGITTITVAAADISVAADGSVTVAGQDLSSLADGTLTVTMNVTDLAGNTGDVTDTTVLDTSAPGTGDGENQINFLDGGDELVSDAESGSVPLSGQVAVGSTVNSITISDGITTITVAAADISVAADGTVTVAGQDLSGLADGTLTVTMNVTDLAGNTGDVTDTTVLDTSAPGTGDGENQINFLDGGDELVSDAESGSVPLSGQVAVGSTVNSITISDGTTTITVTAADISVAADGTVTVAGQDLSNLADGTLTVTMNVTDLAGNTGDVTDTTVLDTSAPGTGDGENQINFLDGGDELVSDAESGSVPLSGQVAVGSTVNSITISDGITTITVTAADISVAADGTVTVAGQDLSNLADGTLTVTMNVTDLAGNTGDVTDTTVLDTSAPGTGDGENQINFLDGGDELVSDAESGSVPLSGQVAVGSTVNSITISDGTTTITVNAVDITVAADGTVTVAGQDLSSLADGTLTVTMNVTDLAGNTGDVTDTTVLDTSAPGTGDGENQINFLDGGDELVSDAESGSVPLSGQVAVGSTVNSITISDGITTITVAAADISVAADGTVTVAGQDLSGLADGTLTVTMNVTDLAGNTGDVTDTTVLDTSAPGTGDGENQINFLDGGDELVSDAESGSVPLSGQVAVGSTVNSITISDGITTITVAAADITVAADGSVTVAGQDLSSLADGTLTVTMNVTDLAGNTGDVTDTTVLDTSAPGTGDGENQINFLDGGDELVSDAESGSVPLSGQVAVGSTVNSITISDGTTTITVTAADISVAADGTVTVAGQDLSGLADGTLTVTMNVTDLAGNTGDVTDTTVLDTSAPGTGDGENQINFLDGGDELVSDAESGSVPLSGQVAVGSTVNSITISDGITTITVAAADITVAADGTVTVAGQDLSSLADGTLTVTMNVTDLAGNTGDVTDTTVLDTSAPGTGDGENQINFLDGGDELVSDAESGSVPLSGQVAVGSTVNSITISDGITTITVAAADISVAADGTVTVAGQDLSSLADGTLTVTMNVTDLAGNTGDVTDTTVLDTSAPGTGDGENQINFLDGGDELVSDAESGSVPLSGQVAVGSTVNSITISDGTTTITVTAADISVAADGTVTVAGQDLSNLADGTLTVTMNVTDLAGNTGDVTDTTVLDTSAPGTGDGENQINFLDGGDELVSDAESGSVPLSGQVAVGSTVNSITISDGITTITVAAADITVAADGSVTVAGQDLSSLADGTLTVTMNVTDLAGNTGDVTDTTVLDTSAPGTGDGENQINFLDGGDELVSDAESGSVPLSGQVAVGSTVNSITISDGTTTITVTAADISVAADGTVTVAGQDLSGLADGTLTVTMNVTDLAGNTGDVTDTTVLDTSAPGTGDGENQINFLDGGDELVSDAESGSVPLSGQVAVGSTVNSITISDSAGGSITIPAANITINLVTGAVTVMGQNLSGLIDGTLTVTMNVTDAAGNTGSVVDTTVLDTTAPSTGDGENTISFLDGGDELLLGVESTNVDFTTSVEADSTINTIMVTDVNGNSITIPSSNINVAPDGTVTINTQNLSGLDDGVLTVTMNVTDLAGNTGDVTDTTTLQHTVQGENTPTWTTTTVSINGVPYIIATAWGVNGLTTISRLNNDGSLTEVDRITYNSANGTVITTSDGDITAQLTAAGLSAGDLGNGLTQSNLSYIDGVPTLFVTSQNSAAITVWHLGSNGTVTFQGGEHIDNSQHFIRENAVYETTDGTEYVYVARPADDMITRLIYDSVTGELTEQPAASTPAGDLVSSVNIVSVDGIDYLLSSSLNGLSLYSINSSTGDLTLQQSVTVPGAGSSNNAVETYTTADGSVYAIFSSQGTHQADIYRVENGSLVRTDGLSDVNFYFSSAGYVNGTPVIAAPQESGGVTLFTLNNNGDLTEWLHIPEIENDYTPPVIVQTPDGNYWLVDGDGNTSATLLPSVTPNSMPVSGDEDTIINGQLLEIDGSNGTSIIKFTLAGNSAEYQPDADGITVDVAGGSLIIYADGSYSFTPDADWSGSIPDITYTTNIGLTTKLDINVNAIADAPNITVQEADWKLESSFEREVLPGDTPVQGIVFYTDEMEGWTPAVDGQQIEVRYAVIPASDGNQMIELNSGSNSGIQRDITTEADQLYTLKLDVMPRGGYGIEHNTFEVFVDGVSIGLWETSDSAGYRTVQFSFVGDGSSQNIVIKNTGTASPGGKGPFIDNVILEEHNGVIAGNAQNGSKTDITLSDYIQGSLSDTDGSEVLTFKIGGLPDGATILVENQSVAISDNSVELTQQQLASAVLRLDNDVYGTLELSISAIANEQSNNNTASASDTLSLVILTQDGEQIISHSINQVFSTSVTGIGQNGSPIGHKFTLDNSAMTLTVQDNDGLLEDNNGSIPVEGSQSRDGSFQTLQNSFDGLAAGAYIHSRAFQLVRNLTTGEEGKIYQIRIMEDYTGGMPGGTSYWAFSNDFDVNLGDEIEIIGNFSAGGNIDYADLYHIDTNDVNEVSISPNNIINVKSAPNDSISNIDSSHESTEEVDTFVWSKGGAGTDHIVDFDINLDKLDLSDLLQGETAKNLDQYLHFTINDTTNTTIIDIDADHNGTFEQHIVLDGVDLSDAFGDTESDIINGLLGTNGDGPLIINTIGDVSSPSPTGSGSNPTLEENQVTHLIP